jgi:hypothetical protein
MIDVLVTGDAVIAAAGVVLAAWLSAEVGSLRRRIEKLEQAE